MNVPINLVLLSFSFQNSATVALIGSLKIKTARHLQQKVYKTQKQEYLRSNEIRQLKTNLDLISANSQCLIFIAETATLLDLKCSEIINKKNCTIFCWHFFPSNSEILLSANCSFLSHNPFGRLHYYAK